MHHHDRKIQNSERLRHLENPEKNCDSWELKLPKSKGMTDRKPGGNFAAIYLAQGGFLTSRYENMISAYFKIYRF